MAISACDLRDHASAQISCAQNEVELRASISRAYYSAFHTLLPLVEALPPSRKSKGVEVTHVELTERLVEWDVKDICPTLTQYRDVKARAQRAMDTARGKRIIADYRLGMDVSVADAQGQIARVDLIRRTAATLMAVFNGQADDGEKKTGTQ